MTVERVGSDIPRALEELPEKFDDFKTEFNEFKYRLLADYECKREEARSYRTSPLLFMDWIRSGSAVDAFDDLCTVRVSGMVAALAGSLCARALARAMHSISSLPTSWNGRRPRQRMRRAVSTVRQPFKRHQRNPELVGRCV